MSAFDESDRPRLREPRPSNMLGSQEWRALSSVPQGGAGIPPSLSSSRRRVMASCLCWRAPCSSHLQTAERARAPDSAQSPWNRSRERTFENQWCRSPGRVGGCAVRIWFEPLVTEQVFCPYKMTLPRTGFRGLVMDAVFPDRVFGRLSHRFAPRIRRTDVRPMFDRQAISALLTPVHRKFSASKRTFLRSYHPCRVRESHVTQTGCAGATASPARRRARARAPLVRREAGR